MNPDLTHSVSLDGSIDDLKQTVLLQAEEIAALRGQVAHLLHIVYGSRRERLDHPGQGLLFAEGNEAEPPAPPETNPEPVPAEKAKRPNHPGRREIPDDLPRHTVTLEIYEDEHHCVNCKAGMVPFEDVISERVKIIPAQTMVMRYVRKQYKCPKGHSLVTAPLPDELIPGCKYDSSVAVHLAVSKYADHLPLNRQVESFRRAGIHMPKSTMCDLTMRLGELLDPIVRAMKRELLRSSYIQSDDTPITVLCEGDSKKKIGHMWVWLHERVVVFDYQLGRGSAGPITFLGDWKGHLQTDGFASYDAVVRANDLVHHGCWAHARRKFFDCVKAKEERAKPMVVLINRLFRIERALNSRSLRQANQDRVIEVRQLRSRSVLNKISDLIGRMQNDIRISPRSALGLALNYLDRQWSRLNAFLTAPEVMIHNNRAERALRRVAVGRKNWLFAGSPRGARVAATLYSLIATCRVLEIPCDQYLNAVVEQLIKFPKTDPETLTPWAWAESKGLPLPADMLTDALA